METIVINTPPSTVQQPQSVPHGPMREATLDTLEQTGVPKPVIDRLRKRETDIRAVQAAQYKPEREAELVRKIREAHEAAETEIGRAEIEAIEAERAVALRQLETELANQHQVGTRRPTDTDRDHADRMTTLQLRETRLARLSTLAASDAALVAQMPASEHATIATLAQRAIDTMPWEIASRVVDAAMHRLAVLGREESRTVPAGGSRPVSRTYSSLEQIAAPMRAAEAAQTPAARRRTIDEQFDGRRATLLRALTTAAQYGGFQHYLGGR